MRRLACLALLLLAAGPAAADPLSDRIAALATDAVSGDGVTGIVVGVELAGAPATIMASGLAEVAAHRPMTPATRFKIASLAKSFLAALAVKLEEEHRLALDDKLAQYLPDIPNAGRVTLRQLLDNTSGYDDYLTDAFVAVAKATPDKHWQPRDLIRFARPEHLRFEPGSRFDYSNTNYLLAGLALEAATKEAVEPEIARRFIQPLHLDGTSAGDPDPAALAQLAHGYADTDDTGVKHDVTEHNFGLGGLDGEMISDANDLMVWCRALFESRVISRKELAEMLTFVPPPEDAAPGTGYGLGLEKLRVDGIEFLGHTGSLPGYTSVMLFQPGTRAVIVIALNEDPTDEAMLDILLERAVAAIEASGALHFPRAPDAEAAPAEGQPHSPEKAPAAASPAANPGAPPTP